MRGLLTAPHKQCGGALAVCRDRPQSGVAQPLGRSPRGTLSVQAAAGGKRPPLKVGSAATPTRRSDSTPTLPSADTQAQKASSNIVPKPGRHSGVEEVTKEKIIQSVCKQAEKAGTEAATSETGGAAGTAGGSTSSRGSGRIRSSSASLSTLQRVQQLEGAHRPILMVVGSAWVLSVAVQLTGSAALTPLWLPTVAGGMLGALFTAAHDHIGVRRLWRSPKAPLRVLITGGSSGVGKALAREFLRSGDTVLITSRSEEGAQQAVDQLQEEVGPAVHISGMACDVSDPAAVEKLIEEVTQRLGGMDVVINNAGYSGSYQSLLDQSAEQVQRVVQTNLLGSLLVTRAAIRAMAQQPGGGHIFNTEGAGSDGSPTPKYAVYGATKCAIAQLLKTLQQETAGLPEPVHVHNVSPGMVLTPLLLEGATPQTKQVFNILCEHPETVAAFLVPRVRSVVARGESGTAIRFLTPVRAMTKFLTAPLHTGKYFDSEGRPVYASERERLLGAAQAKRTQRLQRRAAQRSMPLQLAYSLGMALSFLLIVSDAVAKSTGGAQ